MRAIGSLRPAPAHCVIRQRALFATSLPFGTWSQKPAVGSLAERHPFRKRLSPTPARVVGSFEARQRLVETALVVGLLADLLSLDAGLPA